MHKYRVNATFSLNGGEQEPELSYHQFDSDSVEDFSDDSYFQSTSLESSGGEVSFTVKAEDEYEAEEIAQGVVRDGDEIEDGNSWTWVVEDVNYDIEMLEEPMTLERALEILTALADQADGSEGDEAREAAEFIARHIAAQAQELQKLRAEISLMQASIAEMSAKLAMLEAAAKNSEVEPTA